MAKNEIFRDGDNLSVTCSHPTTPASGDPVRYGELVGVAEPAAQPADGLVAIGPLPQTRRDERPEPDVRAKTGGEPVEILRAKGGQEGLGEVFVRHARRRHGR